MKFKNLFWGVAGAGAGLLVYGAIVEVNKLRVERHTLHLPNWPSDLNGIRIALLADFHLRDGQTVSLAKRAIAQVLAHEPDLILLGGDFVSRWKEDSLDMLDEVFSLLQPMAGRIFAVPGNRDYLCGFPELLIPVFEEYGIRLLRNEVAEFHCINIAGIDSLNGKQADPIGTLEKANKDLPTIVLWHEPDLVGWVPEGAALMLSGHTHGGQFTTPWGWAPITSKNGSVYLRGFFPDAPTPLYVSRGLGTTGPPSRLFCTPEVTILDLVAGG
ncbi:MAG: metallophosphoesterase [Armatimonadetes bacterium]|nr:metallophosphoesterase [Armatimonadota bacterium]